ncbi:threonyl-tRNA synthetase [Calocera cornea HHB12733]|uniref:Threonine--tRNA ligase, cytoplasmic n=1 Tax=Calocera cornea HHB12733 TaxID=1353952 RepID=A0A165I2E9_9BASI|nr:threonyl-tRNA synthetase [Calocera cornea HHB12733]
MASESAATGISSAPHPVQSTSEPAKVAPANNAPKQAKGKKDKAPVSDAKVPLEMTPPPGYIQERIDMWNKLKAEQDEFYAKQPRQEIHITLKDGTVKQGLSWETTPMKIAEDISKSLSEKVVIAKVDGHLWDLLRPLEGSCTLQLLTFEDKEGQQVFWHSSAHVLGEAAERHYGCRLCIGPPTDEGFFYEMSMEERAVQSGDYSALETIAKSAVKDRQKFERLVVPKETLLKMFHYNKYKLELIKSKIPDGTSTTVYRCGPMIDLCVGPHIPHTGKIKAFMVTKNSSSYFLGDSKNDSLQRIYGISFPDTKQLTEYKHFLEEAAKRDHRKIGKEQELFFFHEMSPGSAFFLPHGARIYNTLQDFSRSQYLQRGFTEVISPNMFNSKLWEKSGHWQKYQDDMFTLEVDKEKFGLKPMNCPGHCLIFDSRDRSYKELPLRLADFGVLHRNEASGALSGLTRVRRFQQDDAHIFCMPSQIQQEIAGCFDFLQHMYGTFGFTFKLKLSTRPDNYLGKIETWNTAEKQLEESLNEFVPGKWELNPGDGAFYGPKIDITIEDALRRQHQCATIQLDFQMPERFELKYRGPENDETQLQNRPVMIHRAIYGSLERFIAILTEHFAGKWPFWLSPRQCLVIPVALPFYDYASEVAKKLWDAGLFAEADLGPETLQKKVRNAEVGQWNFILIVGQDEFEGKSVNVRNRDDQATKNRGEVIPFDAFLEKTVALKKERRLENKLL